MIRAWPRGIAALLDNGSTWIDQICAKCAATRKTRFGSACDKARLESFLHMSPRATEEKDRRSNLRATCVQWKKVQGLNLCVTWCSFLRVALRAKEENLRRGHIRFAQSAGQQESFLSSGIRRSTAFSLPLIWHLFL